MKSKFTLIGLVLLFCLPLSSVAQQTSFSFFNAEMLKEAGVRRITVYQSEINDKVAQAGHHNRIRIARRMKKESYIDSEGRTVRELFYDKTGKILTHYLIYEYDPLGTLLKKHLHHPMTNDSSSADEFVKNHTYVYNRDNLLETEVIHLLTDKKKELTDSLTYFYNGSGRLIRIRHTAFADGKGTVINTLYDYKGTSEYTITRETNDQLIDRETVKLDEEGKLKSVAMEYGAGTGIAFEEEYFFDPRGWPEHISYKYGPNVKIGGEKMVMVKYVFDHHGKLSESHTDYANGKRLIYHYDYSYKMDAPSLHFDK